jgi:hypothetical protein
MKKYMFITPETISYKPSFDSPEPDFGVMQFIFEENHTVEDALNDLIELNEHMVEEKPGETFPLDLKNDARRLFNLKEYKEKIRIAS